MEEGHVRKEEKETDLLGSCHAGAGPAWEKGRQWACAGLAWFGPKSLL